MTHVPFDAVRDWMFGAALPFWAEHGVNRADGGFLEELSASGQDTGCSFTRVRVICRQTYVFAHAAALGWSPGHALSAEGFQYLKTRAQLAPGQWAKRLSRKGEVVDASVDLYEFAFVIFAAAWRHRISGDAEARNCAIATLEFIREHMRGEGGGFAHTLPYDGSYLQNPHMHLTEACLFAFEELGDERFLETAREVVELFRMRFFDGGTLGEIFANDWSRADRLTEPGHHFEWAWILGQFQRLTGQDVSSMAEAVANFAECYGVDPMSGAVYDAVDVSGAVTRMSSRIWTNTERLKAALALFELTGKDPRPVLASTLGLIFDRYFAGQIPGLWVDQFDGDGAPLTTKAPASCVYHIFLAFAELLRLEPKIRALPAV